MERKKTAIIAVDFDGTLCDDCFPEIGRANERLISRLKELRGRGTRLILWTCRCGSELEDAVVWCRRFGLEFDAVNDNLPEVVERYGSNARKIFADMYIDDKNVIFHQV